VIRSALRALVIFLVLLGLPVAARADWSLAPFLGRTFQGDTTLIDHEQGAQAGHWHFGASVTMLGTGPLGVEGLIVYTPQFFQQDEPPVFEDVAPVNIVKSRTFALMGNAVLAKPQKRTDYAPRLFLSGGLGLLHASATDFNGLTPVSVSLPGYNIGGGVMGFFSERAGLRLDLRYVGTLKERELKPGEAPISLGPARLSYWTANVGFILRY
jgi:hypothetical protein